MAKFCSDVASAMILLFFSFSFVSAGELSASAKNEIFDNPFVAYGVNPVTKVVTGYLIGLRTAPGRTDECRFAFAGSLGMPSAFSAKYLSEIDGYEKAGSTSSAAVKMSRGDLVMQINKDRLGGECDWILPFIGEPRVKEDAGQVAISFGNLIPGDWIGVFAIRSSRARFYASTDESSVQKAFLVQGDLIYVYDERPGWYYVKYQAYKKMTTGWIKKSDTVQINVSRASSS